MRTNASVQLFVVAVAVTAIAAALPAIAEPTWLYTSSSPTAGTIQDSDGNWTLGVATSGTELEINSRTAGAGTLDMRGAVTNANGTSYEIVGFYPSFRSAVAVTNIYFPTTLRRLGKFNTYVIDSSPVRSIVLDAPLLTNVCGMLFAPADSLTNVVLNLPSLVNIGPWTFLSSTSLSNLTLNAPALRSIGDSAFASCKKVGEFSLVASNLLTIGSSAFQGWGALSNLVLRVPAVTNIGATAFQSSSLAATDVSTWDLSSVRTIGGNAFAYDTMFGDLSLPACESISGGSVGALYSSKIRSLSLTSPKLNSLGNCAIRNCASLKSLVIGSTGTLTVTTTANFDSSVLTNVTFYGPTQSVATIDQILYKVAADTATHGCTIYASRKQAGWTDIATALTEPETTNAPANCFGVYVTAASARKAWLVHKGSPYDPKGSVIIMR